MRKSVPTAMRSPARALVFLSAFLFIEGNAHLALYTGAGDILISTLAGRGTNRRNTNCYALFTHTQKRSVSFFPIHLCWVVTGILEVLQALASPHSCGPTCPISLSGS